MLSPLDLLSLTTKSLVGSPMRSGLSTLGVFMGVFAVNATLQVRDISTAVIDQRLAEQEAPQVQLSIWNSDGRQPKQQDLLFLKQRLQHWQSISTKGYVPGDNVIFRNETIETNFNAVTEDFLNTTGRKLRQGRFFSRNDFERYRPVIVIDEFLAQRLAPQDSILGETVFCLDRPFLVVGIIQTKAEFGGEPSSRGYALIPMTTYSALSGGEAVDMFSIQPRKLNDLQMLQEQAEALLKQRFPDADVYAWSNVEPILMQKRTFEYASYGLTAVGLISLLIGGVGIANITIASIIERTSEIGLRRAIGATRLDIMLQFILEALVLSIVGGMVAIATVHGITSVVAQVFQLPYRFQPRTASLSLGAAVAVGIGACFLPALRASRLDPVQALRER